MQLTYYHTRSRTRHCRLFFHGNNNLFVSQGCKVFEHGLIKVDTQGVMHIVLLGCLLHLWLEGCPLSGCLGDLCFSLAMHSCGGLVLCCGSAVCSFFAFENSLCGSNRDLALGGNRGRLCNAFVKRFNFVHQRLPQLSEDQVIETSALLLWLHAARWQGTGKRVLQAKSFNE